MLEYACLGDENMEQLKSQIQKLRNIDENWSDIVQKYIKENIEPQNKDVLKAFDDFMEYACEQYKRSPEELEKKLMEWLDEDARGILELIKDTLYAYIELKEYRQLTNEDEEKGKQLLKYIFDNAVVRYDPEFHLQYKKWRFNSPKQLLRIAIIFRGLTEYYIERRYTPHAIKNDLLNETGMSDTICEYYIEMYEQNYMTLQLNYVIMQMRAERE